MTNHRQALFQESNFKTFSDGHQIRAVTERSENRRSEGFSVSFEVTLRLDDRVLAVCRSGRRETADETVEFYEVTRRLDGVRRSDTSHWQTSGLQTESDVLHACDGTEFLEQVTV